VSGVIQHVLPLALGAGVGMVWVVWIGAPLFTPVVVGLFVWIVSQLASRTAGGLAARYTGLRGSTTPPRREYSAAQALAARGLYREAVDAYEVAAAESEGDPEPYLAVARILRDHLRDFEASAGWFRRARRDAHLTRGQELLVAQELVELYTTRLGEPGRAIPELARIVQLEPNGPQGQAAARRLAELRSEGEGK
jgi:tetratricopeptide (TPR) repeat protein